MYGITWVLGFRYGYARRSSQLEAAPWTLTPQAVETIHERGGTILGSSRGPRDVREMVESLIRWKIGILFVIGGDGILRGAAVLSQEIARRGFQIGLIGVPETIDNDLQWIQQSFGFSTAVEGARVAIAAAHAEARGCWHGIGLVKRMGRESELLAAHASLANSDVNVCLVSEVPFALEGEHGFLRALAQRLEE